MTDETSASVPGPGSIPAQDLPVQTPTPGFGLLGGVRVLDLTGSIAGPYATLLLSDFGAEIIKLERPGLGDDSRNWGPPFLEERSLWHASVNRNKRSVELDYRGEQGRKVFEELVRKCDVIVSNQLPRVREKLNTGYATIAAINPSIVYVSITGFGTDGMHSDRPCYDIIAEGYSGVMEVTGEAENDPQKIGTPAADLLAGHDAALACLAALIDVKRTGKGHYIDISMTESMTRFLIPRSTVYLGSGEVPRRTGAKDSVIAVYQSFATKDEMITLALNSDPVWHRFWDAVEEPEYGRQPQFATNAGRHAFRAEIVAKIEQILSRKNASEWLALFEAKGVPAGPILKVDASTKDRNLLDRGMFFAIEADGPPIPQVGLGIHVDGQQAGYRSPPPDLGKDTGAVLSELLGYDISAQENLRASGAIPPLKTSPK